MASEDLSEGTGAGSDAQQANLWPVGVAFAVFSTIVGTIGKQLIRYSELCKENYRHSRWLFILGLALQVVLNPACDVAGYALAPASVIAPVTGLDIVWNTVVAPCSLGEQLTFRRLSSSAIIFFTATASVFFRQLNEVTWTTSYVADVLVQSRTMLYALCFVAWFLLNSRIFMKYPKGSAIRGFSLGATAGTLAGNMWCMKIVSVLAEQCLSGNCEAWSHGLPWLVLFGAIFFATSNLYYISRGMQQYEALFMVTVYMGSNIATNSLSAVVILAEMDEAPWWKLGGYTVCILGMMAGMVLLTEGEQETPRAPIRFTSPAQDVEMADAVQFGVSSPLD